MRRVRTDEIVLCRLTDPPRVVPCAIVPRPAVRPKSHGAPAARDARHSSTSTSYQTRSARPPCTSVPEPLGSPARESVGLEHVAGRGVADRRGAPDPAYAEVLEGVPHDTARSPGSSPRARVRRDGPSSRPRPPVRARGRRRLTEASGTSSRRSTTAQVTPRPVAPLLRLVLEPGRASASPYGSAASGRATAGSARRGTPRRSGGRRRRARAGAGAPSASSTGQSSQTPRGRRSSVDSRVPDQPSTSSPPRCRR